MVAIPDVSAEAPVQSRVLAERSQGVYVYFISIRDMQLPLMGKNDIPECVSLSSITLWSELIPPYYKRKPGEPEQVK